MQRPTRPDDIARALKRLRAVEGILSRPPRRALLPFSLWPPGIPAGALSNFFGAAGAGKTQAALQFALEQGPALRFAWIEPVLTAYPPAFVQAGLSLSNILFIQAGGRMAWCALQALRAQAFGLCVLAVEKDSLGENGRDLRRLQLEAERGGGVVLLLSGVPLASWSVRLRLEVRRRGAQLRLREADRAARAVGEGE